MFKTTCPFPDVTDEPMVRVAGEAAACVWLWAWPELLGWPATIAWLFSPVVGNRKWPGDLWGVDARGELLIVEAKSCTRGRRCDPFEDFVGAGRGVVERGSASARADSLRERWSRLFEREREFIRQHANELRAGTSLHGCYPGVVPYSRHRTQVQRWRHVYVDRIAPWIDDPDYSRRVLQYLRKREEKGNRIPHVVGLGAVVEGASLTLSAKGLRHYEALAAFAGADRVHLIAVEARPLGSRRVELVSQRVVARASNTPMQPTGFAGGCDRQRYAAS